MRAYYSLLVVAVANNKINIKNQELSNDLNKNDLKNILDYSYTLLNNDDFLEINGKLTKLTFFGLNNTYYLISINPQGLSINNEDTYSVKIMHFYEKDFNPFNSFIHDYFIKENKNNDIILNTNNDSLINQQYLNIIDSNMEKILATYIELLLIHDKPIVIYSDNLNIYLALIGLLLPYKNLYDLSFTFGSTFKQMKKFNIIGLINERTMTSDNIYYLDFKDNDYPNISLGKYSTNLASYLLNQIDEAKAYKEAIEELMDNHNIDANTAAILNNLIGGKIESFTDPKELSLAIKCSEYKYNNNFIASAIYTKLNKFRINNDMLFVYKYVYDYVESSHDEIINLFFSNLNKFGININTTPEDYLNLIINNAPFDLSDYYDYLVKYDLFNAKYINGIENFNEWYILLDSVCKNIKKNHKQIVPNDILIYYIEECVKLKRIDYLDLVINRINNLNKKASSRLLYFVFEKLDRKIDNYTMDFGIYYTLKILERMNPSDALKFYEKSFNSVTNRKEYIALYIEREEKKPEYYKELDDLLLKDNYNNLLEMKESMKIDITKDFSLDYLDEIYNKNYLNKNKKNDGIFTDKVLEYIKASNNKLAESVNLYNRYYKNLDDNFKDKDTFIRKATNIIYSNPDLLFENDIEYYDDLFELDIYLQKRKSNSSILLDVLKSGLDIKKAYINDKFRYKYFKDLLLKDNKWFNELGNEYYNKYYLRYLLSSFYKFIPSISDMKNSSLIMTGFNSLFNGLKNNKGFNYAFVNTLINYDKDDFKLNYLFFLLFVTNNEDKVFESIRDEIEEKKTGINKIYKEYYRVIKTFDWSKDLNNKALDYINYYLLDNLGFIRKIIWKIFKR